MVYDSLTGQGKRFAQRISDGYCIDILDYEEQSEPVFLITRSYNFGEIPFETQEFLEEYAHKVVGVAVGGNRNWGTNFGAAGVKIEKMYGIPLVLKYEGSGFSQDVEIVKNWIEEKGKENDSTKSQ